MRGGHWADKRQSACGVGGQRKPGAVAEPYSATAGKLSVGFGGQGKCGIGLRSPSFFFINKTRAACSELEV